MRKVSIQVAGGPALPRLGDQISTRGRGGLVGFRRVLGWIPFVPEVPDRPLDPVEVQRDKERLRRHYERKGYPRARVDYEVDRVASENAVDITFRIEPGPPLLVSSVTVVWDSAGPTPGVVGLLSVEAPRVPLHPGEPLDQDSILPAVASITRWLADRGYPFATVEPVVAVDSPAARADVTLRTDDGSRVRVGAIAIEGNRYLPSDAIRRLLDVRTGEWYSATRLGSASQRIASLDAVASARFETRRSPNDAGSVDLLLDIREQPPRRVAGELGYATDGGFTGQASWSHSNILGHAQTLTADVAGQSGVLALAHNPDRFVRTGLTLRLPVQGRANLTFNVGPYVEYRDDFRDRSTQLGMQSTLLYQFAPLSSVSLRYELATRRIIEYRFGDFSGGIDVLKLLQLGAQGVLDSLGARLGTQTVSLSAVVGALDVPADPTRGFTLEPTVLATVPGSLSSSEYVTAIFRASAYLPLGRRIGLAARLGGGKLFPFGKSVPPSQEQGLVSYFRLRDVLFTGGGAGDVRGWSSRLLGPKLPEFIIPLEPDSGATLTADRFVPIGGFNLLHGSAEVRFPLAFLGPDWGTFDFVDAGRVWTHDVRFTSPDDPYGVERWFWSVGLGLDYRTPFGALRVALGFKVNPSVLDLASPQEVLDAILAGTPLDQLPRHPWKRAQLHLEFGRRL